MKGSIVFIHAHSGGLTIGLDNPDPTRSFIRGTEIALVRLAQELVKKDWLVAVALEGTQEIFLDSYGVWWHPLTDLNKLVAPDSPIPGVLISLLTPEPFQKYQRRLNILWGHYAHLNVGKLDRTIDHYVLGTDWHQWSVREHDKRIDSDKCVIIGSGVDLERYQPETQTIYGRMVYSSSADRGLHHLLRFWPILKNAMPHVSLKVFYDPKGMEIWKWTHELRAEMARQIDQAQVLDGVEFVGPVDPWTLAREQMQADLFVYPCTPTDRTESFCLSIMENLAAGIPVLTTDADCLPEMYGNSAFFLPQMINDVQWVEQIGKMLSDRDYGHSLVPIGKRIAEAFTWERVATRWDIFLQQRLQIANSDREAWTTLGEDVSNLQRMLVGRAAQMKYNQSTPSIQSSSPTEVSAR